MKWIVPIVVLLAGFLVAGCHTNGSGFGKVLDSDEGTAKAPPPPDGLTWDFEALMRETPEWDLPWNHQFTAIDKQSMATVVVYRDRSFVATLPNQQGSFGRTQFNEREGSGWLGAVPEWKYWDDRRPAQGLSREWNSRRFREIRHIDLRPANERE